jgi:hypothetical protein
MTDDMACMTNCNIQIKKYMQSRNDQEHETQEILIAYESRQLKNNQGLKPPNADDERTQRHQQFKISNAAST